MKRDEELFEEDYQKYSPLVFRIAYSYVKNYDDCQDLMQEVFYRLLYKAPKFKSEEHKKCWLIRITINICKDYHKSFWNSMTEKLDGNTQDFDYSQQENIIGYVQVLPNQYKEIILLYYLCGYSIKEIAEILRLGESAVKMRLSRARKYLRIQMEE